MTITAAMKPWLFTSLRISLTAAVTPALDQHVEDLVLVVDNTGGGLELADGRKEDAGPAQR